MMKKILIGWILDGKAGGVDKYILDLYEEIHGKYAHVDFMSNLPAGELAEKVKKNGSRWFTMPSLFRLSGQYHAVKNAVKENHYDAVYFNYSTSIGWAAVKGARDGGAAHVIVHAHSSGFCATDFFKETVTRALHYLCRPFTVKYTTDFISCSDKAALWIFGKRTVQKGKVRYVINDADDRLFYPSAQKREEYRRKFGVEDCFVIGHTGNLQKVKNQAFLIGLMPELKKRIPKVRLLLVGQGETLSALLDQAKRLGVEREVIFAGYADTADGIMNAFDVFCLPSLMEGYPYVAIEAQKTGLICLLSDRITKQVIRTERCRYLPLKDPDRWVGEIERIADTRELQNPDTAPASDTRFSDRVTTVKDILNIQE